MKAQIGAGERLPKLGKIFLSVENVDKPKLINIAKRLQDLGYGLCSTLGTAKFLREHGIGVQIVNKVREGRPHIVDAIKNGEIAMVVNTVGSMPESVADSHSIRSSALQQRIPVYTTVAGADAISQGLNSINDTKVYRLQEMN